MSRATRSILLVLFVTIIYVGLPAVIIWGWVRWWKRAQLRTWPSILSLVGFALATASGLLAISGLLDTHVIGGSPFTIRHSSESIVEESCFPCPGLCSA